MAENDRDTNRKLTPEKIKIIIKKKNIKNKHLL